MDRLGAALSGLAIALEAAAGPLRPVAVSRDVAIVPVSAPESVARMRSLSGRMCRDIGELVRERDDTERRLRMEGQDADTVRLAIQGVRQALRARQDEWETVLIAADRELRVKHGRGLAEHPDYRRELDSAWDCLDR